MPMLAGNDKSPAFPDWSETRKFGVHRVAAGTEIEPHFHDCHEYWVIVSGEGDALSEGTPFHLGPGDMLLTEAGESHSMFIAMDMVAVTYFGFMPPHGRWGHLHAGIDKSWGEHLAALKGIVP